MGGILEPTPQMGPFHIEIRGESFYFRAPAAVLRVTARNQWAVPVSAAAQAVAAMDQAMDNPPFVEHIADGRPFSNAPQAEPADGWVEFVGWTGEWAYAGNVEENGHDHAEVELLYQDTPAIRWILNALSDAPSPVPHWADDPDVPLAQHRPTLTPVGTGYPRTARGSCSCGQWKSREMSPPDVTDGWIEHVRSLQSTPSIPA